MAHAGSVCWLWIALCSCCCVQLARAAVHVCTQEEINNFTSGGPTVCSLSNLFEATHFDERKACAGDFSRALPHRSAGALNSAFQVGWHMIWRQIRL